MKALPYIMVVGLLSWIVPAGWAEVGVPVMPPTGDKYAEPNIKSPPLRTSDHFRVPLELHNKFDIPNWAGFRVKFHIKDSKEISVTPASILYGIAPSPVPPGTTIRTPGTLVEPTFPQSTLTPRSSFTRFRTVWHPNAQQSGRPLLASEWFNLVDLSLHAKSTNQGENSDVDMTVMAWNIRHLRAHITPLQGSTQFPPSAYVWASSEHIPQPGHTLPSFPPQFNDPNAHWVQIPFPWHASAPVASYFIATLAGTAFIGLEHVPEPMTAVLAGSGVLLFVCGLGLRRRRLSL